MFSVDKGYSHYIEATCNSSLREIPICFRLVLNGRESVFEIQWETATYSLITQYILTTLLFSHMWLVCKVFDIFNLTLVEFILVVSAVHHQKAVTILLPLFWFTVEIAASNGWVSFSSLSPASLFLPLLKATTFLIYFPICFFLTLVIELCKW